MPLSEFNLIERFFTHQGVNRQDVVAGIGDDCALLTVPPGAQLAVSIDSLLAGVHFPQQTPAAAVGHKALAVGLSDLAAMGADPAWATLALALPQADEAWLEAFASGLFALARHHGVQLVGGDTVHGPLSVTLQLHGFVPAGRALRRETAQVGDRIYVSGSLGDAGMGLALVQGQAAAVPADFDYLRGRLDRPSPRIELGRALRGLAHAAIDLSDGLAADLGHILERSGVGARIDVETLPLSGALLRTAQNHAQALRLALSAGDDYELCFTVPPQRCARLEAVARELECPLCQIGEIEEAPGLRLVGAGGESLTDVKGYRHF